MAAAMNHQGTNNGHKESGIQWLLLSALTCLMKEHYELRSLQYCFHVGFLFCFFFWLQSMWDLSSPTRDGTCTT